MDQEISFEPVHVKAQRTAQGLTLEMLARYSALSIRQLKQLEEGGHDAFYSPAIKQLALRKVMATLDKLEGMEILDFSPQKAEILAFQQSLPRAEESLRATRPARFA